MKTFFWTAITTTPSTTTTVLTSTSSSNPCQGEADYTYVPHPCKNKNRNADCHSQIKGKINKLFLLVCRRLLQIFNLRGKRGDRTWLCWFPAFWFNHANLHFPRVGDLPRNIDHDSRDDNDGNQQQYWW